MENEEKNKRAKDCAKGCWEFLKDLYDRLDSAIEKPDNEKEVDEIETQLDEADYGQSVDKHYSITLAGGGPAARIHGLLDENDEPATAELQYQDWFTEWIEYREADEDVLLRFAQRHYFKK